MGGERQRFSNALWGRERKRPPRHAPSRLGRFALLLSTIPLLGFGPAPVDGNNQVIGLSNEALAYIPEVGGETFSVTTYNVADGRKSSIGAVSEVIRKEAPDIACVQEISSKNIDELSQKSGLEHAKPAWAHSIDGGHAFGLAILSELAITSNEIFRLYREDGHAQRILQVATLDNRGQRLIAANTHLVNKKAGLFGPDRKEERLHQAREVASILAQPRFAGIPKILCGDFNTHPDSEVHQVLMGDFDDVTQRLGGSLVTFPGLFHNDQKDFVTFDEASDWLPLRQHTSGMDISDHLALTSLLIAPQTKQQ